MLSAVADGVEVHCHGGPRVVRWVVEQCVAQGAFEAAPARCDTALALLPYALTERTAAILLDQMNGTADDLAKLANARRFARPDAAEKIARSLERWSAGRKAARAGVPGSNGGEER